jgi:hypothetical protein
MKASSGPRSKGPISRKAQGISTVPRSSRASTKARAQGPHMGMLSGGTCVILTCSSSRPVQMPCRSGCREPQVTGAVLHRPSQMASPSLMSSANARNGKARRRGTALRARPDRERGDRAFGRSSRSASQLAHRDFVMEAQESQWFSSSCEMLCYPTRTG